MLTELPEMGEVVGGGQAPIDDRPDLPAVGDDADDSLALGRIARDDAASLGGLVVGMAIDGQEGERFDHGR